MSTVEQSGTITPGHLASWTTDGIIQDAGVTFFNTYGLFASSYLAVNFNSANTDFPIPIALPAGYTRYFIEAIILSGASGSLTNCTCALSMSQNLGGFVVIANQTPVTVATSSGDIVNNLQNFTITGQNFVAFVETTVFFRVQTPQGSAATGNVTIFYRPLP